MERLALYRLVPTARPDDPNWDRAPNRGEALVRARSSSDARVVATQAERQRAVVGIFTTEVRASAFLDEKLYTVRDEPTSRYPSAGPRTVLEGVAARV
ncbi:MAG: hypothetical protein ACYC0C_16450 [Devosia sp.]